MLTSWRTSVFGNRKELADDRDAFTSIRLSRVAIRIKASTSKKPIWRRGRSITTAGTGRTTRPAIERKWCSFVRTALAELLLLLLRCSRLPVSAWGRLLAWATVDAWQTLVLSLLIHRRISWWKPWQMNGGRGRDICRPSDVSICSSRVLGSTWRDANVSTRRSRSAVRLYRRPAVDKRRACSVDRWKLNETPTKRCAGPARPARTEPGSRANGPSAPLLFRIFIARVMLYT